MKPSTIHTSTTSKTSLFPSPTLTVPPNTPLSPILSSLPSEITSLTLLSPPSGPDLIALTAFLSTDTQIITLSISNHPLPPSLPSLLLKSLSHTSPLRSLILHNASLSSKATPPIAHLLSSLPVPLSLDLSNNRLNTCGIRTVQTAIKFRSQSLPKVSLNLSGNLHNVELLNTATHALGAFFALLGGLLLTLRAFTNNLPPIAIFSLAAFSLSLVTLMASSAFYHGHFRNPTLSYKFHKLDLCLIFILIAGSYTPFLVCYTLKPPTIPGGAATLVAVWVCAAVGVTWSLLGADSSLSRSFFALLTGWIGIFVFDPMFSRMEPANVSALVGGGVTYSLGMIFFLLGQKRPMLHVVWHLAVIVGGGLHYFALWNYVSRYGSIVP